MDLCKSCGAELEPELRFCEMCGVPIAATVPQIDTNQPSPFIPEPPPPFMPESPPPIIYDRPPQPDLVPCKKCMRLIHVNEKCPFCKSAVPVWLIIVLFIALFVSIVVSSVLSTGVGLIISLGCGAIAIRNYTVQKKGVDIVCIVFASICIFINICFFFI